MRAQDFLFGAQGGDISAFEKLAERYRDNVYSLGLQMTGSETAALNIAQKSFLSAYPHLKEFRTEVDFGTWTMRSAAQLTMLQPRGVVRAIENELNSEEPNQRGGPVKCCSVDWSHGADVKSLSTELRRAIQEATDQLPQDERAVLLFKDLAAITYEQISEIMGVSVQATKHRLHRARLCLRAAIDRQASVSPMRP